MLAGVHGRAMSAATAPVVAKLLADMVRNHIEPVVQQGLADWLGTNGQPTMAPTFSTATGLPKGVGVVISLGGDGTFLDSVAIALRADVPVLGINLGRLGFLSSVPQDGAESALRALVNNAYDIEERTVLHVQGVGVPENQYALNEVSVHKRDTSTMLSVHAYLDDRFLNTYWGDGLIVSTPTGSTAYSLSCGGPLLEPQSGSLVITPIAPHNLNVRPFVVHDRTTVRLSADARGEKYLVNMDSRSITLDHSAELRIARAPFNAKLVRLQGQDFLDNLRAKLAWGLDVRSSKG